MFIHSNYFTKIALLIVLLCAACVNAEPYLAFKNNLPCSACHVNPIGGGERTTYGAYYGSQVLPETAGSATGFDAGNLSETLRVGANFRANYYQSDRDEGDDSKTFETQTGQVYLVFQPKDSRFTLYIDEQVAPGGALNREAFIMTKFGQNNYVKAGKLMLPYGIRLEDNTAFIRQASGINFHNSDNGVEVGFQYDKALINLAVSNGSTGASNDDKQFQYLARSEYIGNNWRLGASAILNDAEAGARTMMNIFGGFNWLGFTFLVEGDHIQDKSISHVPGDYETQNVMFFEINREIMKGYNLKLTTEYLDPDTHIKENQRTRQSILLEYTPFANLQLRSGVRLGKDIPQKIDGNYTDFFVQLHFYL